MSKLLVTDSLQAFVMHALKKTREHERIAQEHFCECYMQFFLRALQAFVMSVLEKTCEHE